MAFEQHIPGLQKNYPAIGTVPARSAVKLVGTGVLFAQAITAAADEVYGISGADDIGPNEQVLIYQPLNIVKVRAAATVIAGVKVGVTNASGFQPAASGAQAGGIAHSTANPGEFFACEVRPTRA